MTIIILSPGQLKLQIAKQAKERRLEKNYSRATLSAKSDVPESTIKRFERTGDIGMDALLRIALVLDALNDFGLLFSQKAPTLLSKTVKKRKRGRA